MNPLYVSCSSVRLINKENWKNPLLMWLKITWDFLYEVRLHEINCAFWDKSWHLNFLKESFMFLFPYKGCSNAFLFPFDWFFLWCNLSHLSCINYSYHILLFFHWLLYYTKISSNYVSPNLSPQKVKFCGNK